MLRAHFTRVGTHEGAFSSSLNLPNFSTHGGALLPERAPGACSGSKIPRVYRSLRLGGVLDGVPYFCHTRIAPATNCISVSNFSEK